jgi:hypothetical protein
LLSSTPTPIRLYAVHQKAVNPINKKSPTKTATFVCPMSYLQHTILDI